MMLNCSFEELAALDAAVERVRGSVGVGGVAAPPAALHDVDALAPRLTGDLDIEKLAEQESVQRALEFLLAEARERTDTLILEQYPAAEDAVQAYFEYAYVLTVLDRVRQMGDEMRAIIDLMTGSQTDPDPRGFSFNN
ncbi:MAG: hypothetical protein ACREL7_04315 [Longimicrobiales bacterium]